MPKDPALVCHVRSLFPKQSSCCLSVVWVPGLGTCTSRACCHGVVLIAHESPLPFFAADRIPASQLWEKRVKQGICNAKRSHPCQGLGRGLSFRQGALESLDLAQVDPGHSAAVAPTYQTRQCQCPAVSEGAAAMLAGLGAKSSASAKVRKRRTEAHPSRREPRAEAEASLGG